MDGKITGLQTEMRQGFLEIRQDFGTQILEVRQDFGAQILEIHSKLDQQGELLQQILNRLPLSL